MSSCLPAIRVLDLSRVFAGPWAAQILADLGADVVKVEHPDGGDDVRRMGLPRCDRAGAATGETSSFLAMNRGKRSIAIDFAQPDGRRLVADLAAEADVLVENYRAGSLTRHGLGYPSLSERNPRLVYCSITGFGQDGPYASLPGYDPLFQAMSGLLSITGTAEGLPGAGPAIVGYSVADINAGLYAAIAILAALHHRDTISGRGQHIDLALLDAQVAAQSHTVMNYLVSGRLPRRSGTASQINTPWQAFDTADGSIVVAIGNDRQFAALCAVIGHPAMAAEARFATNQARIAHTAELVPALADILRIRSTEHWRASFNAVGVPCGPVNDMAEMAADPQVRHREMLRDMPDGRGGVMPFVANPIRFSDTPIAYGAPPPQLGEGAESILADWLGGGDVPPAGGERQHQ